MPLYEEQQLGMTVVAAQLEGTMVAVGSRATHHAKVRRQVQLSWMVPTNYDWGPHITELHVDVPTKEPWQQDEQP
jgi:hypothetical protein